MSDDTEGEAREAPEPPVDVPSLAPADLAERIAAGESVRILDVRDRDETEAWRIDGPDVSFSQVPLSRFLAAQVSGGVADLIADLPGEGPITAVCGRGEASDYVAGLLTEEGIEAHNLAGGMDAWAGVYRATPILEGDPTIVQYERPATGCLAYMVVSGGEAAVVDPLRAFTDRYLADAGDRDVDIVAVLDTHLHADHLSGRADLATSADATAYVPAETAARDVDGGFETLADGDTVPLGEIELRAVALPGHTTDMTGYAVGDLLMTGDSLFLDCIARPDLQEDAEPAALAAQLHRTLTERLGTFEDDTLVAPGHRRERTAPDEQGRYVARLGDLRESVKELEASAASLREQLTGEVPPPPANAARIVAANRGETSLDAETAFELELGPNNCAL